MKKYELEQTVEDKNQTIDIVDRLSQHINHLWGEICEKHDKNLNQMWEIRKLKNDNARLLAKCKSLIAEKNNKEIDKAEVEKDLNDFLNIQRTDN